MLALNGFFPPDDRERIMMLAALFNKKNTRVGEPIVMATDYNAQLRGDHHHSPMHRNDDGGFKIWAKASGMRSTDEWVNKGWGGAREASRINYHLGVLKGNRLDDFLVGNVNSSLFTTVSSVRSDIEHPDKSDHFAVTTKVDLENFQQSA